MRRDLCPGSNPAPGTTYKSLYKGAADRGLYKGILTNYLIFTFLRDVEIFCFFSFVKLQAAMPEEVK